MLRVSPRGSKTNGIWVSREIRNNTNNASSSLKSAHSHEQRDGTRRHGLSDPLKQKDSSDLNTLKLTFSTVEGSRRDTVADSE